MFGDANFLDLAATSMGSCEPPCNTNKVDFIYSFQTGFKQPIDLERGAHTKPGLPHVGNDSTKLRVKKPASANQYLGFTLSVFEISPLVFSHKCLLKENH